MNDNNKKKNNKNVLRTHDDVIYFPVFSLLQLSGAGKGTYLSLLFGFLFLFMDMKRKNWKKSWPLMLFV